MESTEVRYARCDYRVPNDYPRPRVMVARYREHCHRPLELRPGTVLATLQFLDALRRSEHLDLSLLACEAGARSRAGFAEGPYPHAALLTRALAAARAVAVRPLVASLLRRPIARICERPVGHIS